MTMKEYLNKVMDSDPDIETTYGIIHDVTTEDRPQIPDAEGEYGPKDLDFENNQMLSIEENRIKYIGGGDWQNPHYFDLVWDENQNIFKFENVREMPESEQYPEDGVSFEDLKKFLGR